MERTVPVRVIARIRSEFPEKFGIPRQSGLVEGLQASVVFEPPYRVPEAVRGLEDFSHIWLIWQFSESLREGWSPTVRPPRLGGNVRVGVFASRSPFRPSGIGLSSVRLERVELLPDLGPVLLVRGADLMDGTPILDIKPYLPYSDCHPEAVAGFADQVERPVLEVEIPPRWLELVPRERREALAGVLACDPRPPYQRDPERVYSMAFAGCRVWFTVAGGRLTVRRIEPEAGPEGPAENGARSPE